MKQLITLLLALITLTGQAKNERSNERVWNDVVTGYNNTYNQVKVTKVTFYEDRTELSLHVDLMAGQWISIAEKTFLQADGKQYAVKDVTVLKACRYSRFQGDIRARAAGYHTRYKIPGYD